MWREAAAQKAGGISAMKKSGGKREGMKLKRPLARARSGGCAARGATRCAACGARLRWRAAAAGGSGGNRENKSSAAKWR